LKNKRKLKKARKGNLYPYMKGGKLREQRLAGEGELGRRQVWKVHCSEE
jgi:hypothetical protein